MNSFATGFMGRRRKDAENPALPPGQYLTDDFPVLSAGPTPRVPTDEVGTDHHHRARCGCTASR